VIPAPAAPLLSLGRYRLLLELGHGGMARVYLAFSSGLGGFNKLVVLKVLRDELHDDEGARMFLGEARLAARMNHPNIVQTLEVGEDGGRYFICMEYLEGQTLGRLMKQTFHEPLTLAARLELICQVLEALVYMHEFRDLDGTPLQLVHRDLSPNNVLVTYDGTAKVLDFGVAKAAGVSHATEAGMFKGKLGYAAPEQIMGKAEQRSDVFAMGVLLWEVACYRRLSQDRTQQEIVQGRLTGVDPALMQDAQGVPAGLLEICSKAAAKQPQDRFASALEMRDALRAYMREHRLELSQEELRALLGGLFASEREESRRLIDQRMKQAKLEDEHPSIVSPVVIPTAPSTMGGLGGSTAPYASSAPGSSPPYRPDRRKLALGALAVTVLAGVAWATLNTRGPRSGPTAANTSAAIVNTAVKSTELPTPVASVRIVATPEDAEIYLDGAKLDSNPFIGQVRKDAHLHRLEVKSPGRVTDSRMVRFDQKLDLLITLRVDESVAPRPGVARAAAVKPAPSAATKRTPAIESGPEKPRESLTHRNKPANARPIDDSDPYAP
jgi:serine/threonine protein kinase